MLVQSCFANIYLLLVCRSRCRRLVILLKLPNVLIQKFCYHGNMTSLLSSLLSLSRFSSSFNNVIRPASQWSANTHFTLPITPFVRYTSSAGHITSSLPLNWCNVSDRQCPLPLVASRVSLCGPFCLRFMGSIFLSIALCADLGLYLAHSGFF